MEDLIMDGFIRRISQESLGYLFENSQGNMAWPISGGNVDFEDLEGKYLEIVYKDKTSHHTFDDPFDDETIWIESAIEIAHPGDGGGRGDDLNLVVFVVGTPNRSSASLARMHRLAESRAGSIRAALVQELPPWLRIEVRAEVLLTNEATHPHVYCRMSIFNLVQSGYFGDWVPNQYHLIGGPSFNGAGGHASGSHSVTYRMGGTSIDLHEVFHNNPYWVTKGFAPHTKEYNRSGELVEYAKGPAADWMGSGNDRRPNVLTRRSMKMLWEDRVLHLPDSSLSVEAILAPVESIPSAIPEGCYQAVCLPGSIYLSVRTIFGIHTAGGQQDSIHVNDGSQQNIAIGESTHFTPITHRDWLITTEDTLDGLVKVKAVHEDETRAVIPASFPEETLTLGVESGNLSRVHAGIWEDRRFPKQGLGFFYIPSTNDAPPTVAGVWFTQTQERDGRGKTRWMTMQGEVINGVAEMTLREDRGGDLVDVGRARMSFDDGTIGEFQFALDTGRGQLLLSKVMDAKEGSSWWYDKLYRHEGVLIFKDEHATKAWLFKPGDWKFLDTDEDLIGIPYTVRRSSFLNTREAELFPEREVIISGGTANEPLMVALDGVDRRYRTRLI